MRALAIATLLISCASPRTPPVPGPFANLAWLAGSWRGEGKEGTVEELWSTPSGGVMLGSGRVVTGERLVFFEFLRIESRAGVLVYVAQPRGGAPTEFRGVTISDTVARFENPAHDFPRVVEYRHRGNELVTHVEGVENGAPLVEEVTLRRVE